MSLYKRTAMMDDLKARAKKAFGMQLANDWRKLATPYEVKRAPAFLQWEGRASEK